MCQYCNEDFDGYYKPLDINWYGHKMKININYCPMCGRKLGG